MHIELVLDLLNDLTDLADDAELRKLTQAQLVSGIREVRDGIADTLHYEAREASKRAQAVGASLQTMGIRRTSD